MVWIRYPIPLSTTIAAESPMMTSPRLLLGNEPDGIQERDNGGAQQCERGDTTIGRRPPPEAERAEKRKITSQ